MEAQEQNGREKLVTESQEMFEGQGSHLSFDA